MSGWWLVIAPVAVLGFGAVAFLSAYFSGRPGEHRAGPVRLEVPDVRAAVVPVAEVAGQPPWDDLPGWARPEADRYSGYGWASGSSGSSYGLPPGQEALLCRELHHVDELDFGAAEGAMRAPGATPYPEDGAGDESEGSGLTAPPAPPMLPAPLLGLPRTTDGRAADEWRGWPEDHPPEPSRLLRTTGELLHADLLAECSTFMARQDAEVAAWLAAARERWAA